MKVYVKKDKALKLLGEGKVYSKKDLLLKELNGINANTVNIPMAKNVKDGAMKFNQVQAVNPTTKFGSGSADDLMNQSNGMKDNQILVNTKSPESMETAQSTLDKMSTDDRENTDVTYFDGNETSSPLENSSVAPRKVMDEMRANSVPFTKKELTAFLKSL